MKLKLKVFTNSGRQEIIKISDEEYKIYLKKAPENNKANEEMVRLLTKHFCAPVKLIKGRTSKNKLVEIEDGDKIL